MEINIIGSSKDKWSKLSNLKSGTVVFEHSTGTTIFQTIEHAYQYTKVLSSGDAELARQVFFAPTGYGAKYLGNRVFWKGTQKSNWERRKFRLIERIMRDHYTQDQNKDRLALLLETGDAILTHKHPTLNLGKWETEFPRILMKLREELKSQIQHGSNPVSDSEPYSEEQPTDIC